jgi:hypothetical protein
MSTWRERPTPDPGCLLTNGAIEAPALNDGARGAIAGGLQTIREAFEDVISGAQLQGQVRADADAALLAERLLSLYQGLLVLVRFGHPTNELAAIPAAIPAILDYTDARRSS